MSIEAQPQQKLPSIVEIDKGIVLRERSRRKSERGRAIVYSFIAGSMALASTINLAKNKEEAAAFAGLTTLWSAGVAVNNTRFGEKLRFQLGRSDTLFIDKAQGRKKRKLEAQCKGLLQQDDFDAPAFTEKLIGLVGGSKHGLGTSAKGKFIHHPDNTSLSIQIWNLKNKDGVFAERDGVTEFNTYHVNNDDRGDGKWYASEIHGWFGEEYLMIGGSYQRPTLTMFALGDYNERDLGRNRVESVKRNSAITGKSEELPYDKQDHQYIMERTLAPEEVKRFCDSLLRAHLQGQNSIIG